MRGKLPKVHCDVGLDGLLESFGNEREDIDGTEEWESLQGYCVNALTS